MSDLPTPDPAKQPGADREGTDTTPPRPGPLHRVPMRDGGAIASDAAIAALFDMVSPEAQIEAAFGFRPSRRDTPPPAPPKRTRATRAIFKTRAEFVAALRWAMGVALKKWGPPITKPSVAEAFRMAAAEESADPWIQKLRNCDARRIRDWCAPRRFDVDFDTLAREVESA